MPITTQIHAFTRPEIESSAPDYAGVYGLYKSGVIYYGMSTTSIRDRLLSHLDGYEGSCTSSAWTFNAEMNAYAAGREAQLLNEHKAAFGVLPACNDKVG